MKRVFSVIILGSLSLSLSANPENNDFNKQVSRQAASSTPAFPGAEGGGWNSTGGRGGKILYVTNLEDYGKSEKPVTGSLRWAVEQEGPRMVLFKVSGNIPLKETLVIENADLTIAGQSAPGDGICVKDHGILIQADNVMIRFIRCRLGDVSGKSADAIGGSYFKGGILDHCSFSWSIDEVCSFYYMIDHTIQWCIISEGLHQSAHWKGAHGKGSIWGGTNCTLHHNLYAHNFDRNPRFVQDKYYKGPEDDPYLGASDCRNNVMFNWGSTATYGGENRKFNLVANYYKPGPASIKPKIFFKPTFQNHFPGGTFYIADNYITTSADASKEKTKGILYDPDKATKGQPVFMERPFEITGPVTTHTPQEAYHLVLSHAGASLSRDAVDVRIAEEVASGKPTFTGSRSGFKGIPDTPADTGGYPVLKSLPAPVDRDGDGIPDAWEEKNGLNPDDASDGNTYTLDQNYTNVEVYLNTLVQHIIDAQSQGGGGISDKKYKTEFEKLNQLNWALAFHDDFSGDWRKNWHKDGHAATITNRTDGMLLCSGSARNESSSVVAWIKHFFKGHLKIEYDYTRVDTAKNNSVNIIYIQAQGCGREPYVKDIFAWADLRANNTDMPVYYNNMDTYHISYATEGENKSDPGRKYVRGRRYMPLAGKKLAGTNLYPEYQDLELFERGVQYHITIIKKGGEIYMHVAGAGKEHTFYFDARNLPPIEEGYIGLRQMTARCSLYANFKVFEWGDTAPSG